MRIGLTYLTGMPGTVGIEFLEDGGRPVFRADLTEDQVRVLHQGLSAALGL